MLRILYVLANEASWLKLYGQNICQSEQIMGALLLILPSLWKSAEKTLANGVKLILDVTSKNGRACSQIQVSVVSTER